MSTLSSEIVQEVREFAVKILTAELPEGMTYHCLDHTKNVVEAALEIGKNSGLSEEELEILEVAAWFHDLGYKEDSRNHEAMGAELAGKFLAERDYPEDHIQKVKSAILATRLPQSPRTLIDEVLCDADLTHLARENYEEKSDLLKQEIETLVKMQMTKKQWMEKNIIFLTQHRYFTAYAQTHFQPRVDENLKKVKKQVKKMNKKEKKGGDLEHEVAQLKEKLKKSKDLTPTRGIETMFRLTSKNHLNLSSMADSKANIMISVNSIILSVLVSVLFRKLEEYPHLVIPTGIMTLVCLTTIVFAILATRPNVSRGKFTYEDIKNKKTNLLFFGNFHQMKRQDYEWGMKEMMKDADYLYSSLIKDIYYLGVVLGKKYKLLRISYTVFMFGFVIAVLSFMVAEVFFKTPAPY